jgi:general secretion pathway protein E
VSRVKKDQRCAKRIALARQLPCSFLFAGKQHVALLREVTSQGGSFLLPLTETPAGIKAGTVLELSIQTDVGPVGRKGSVVWTHTEEGMFCFGMKYLDLPLNAVCLGVLDMDRIKIDPAWALRIPPNLAFRRQVIPFACSAGHVYVACANVMDSAALAAVEKMVGLPLQAEPAEPQALQRALDRVYGDPLAATANVPQLRSRSVDLRSPAELQPEDMVALCEELLQAAILRQASDIHIDPHADNVHVRFRVDGALEVYRQLPMKVNAGLLSRFKVLCGMDIAEKRAPQDGAFKHRFGRAGQTIDIRVATLPTKHGERMTLRLLALQTEALTLERLGMCPRDLVCFEQAIEKPHGLLLLTGPTGSGKSTTLYAAIRHLMARENLNILTVEDPIEYEIKGVAQAEVDSADKVTFIKALRSVLRHDPDVVMIGEIRDGETADVAIKASLTGHLVFSTLHTNSAVSVITRLADMGVDRFLIAATLRLAVAQRLVRQLCPRCRKPRELTARESARSGRANRVRSGGLYVLW